MSIQTIFNANLVKTLRDVVSPVGIGFIMPEYQRPYKWSEENIERLIDDIVGGLSRSNAKEVETLFLGTLIVVQAQNSEFTKYLQNQQKYASPAGIYYVVDGQQRLSTLAILAIVLRREIIKLIEKLDAKYSSDLEYVKAKSVVESDILDLLTEFYGVNFSGSANPKLKPLILRKTQEFWIREGSQEYVSPIAKYIAEYIHDEKKERDYMKDGDMYEILQINQKKIFDELQAKLLDGSNVFNLVDNAKAIFPDEFLFNFEFVLNADHRNKDDQITHLLKYCLFTLFMSKHCCVNYLEPKNHQWAIEVFQSLNSTGIPLSALEVFKAYVYQNTHIESKYGDLIADVFGTIEEQLISTNDGSAQHKTDVFLTAFALGFNGEKIGMRYTEQNKYLQKTFDNYAKNILTIIKTALGKSSIEDIPMFEYMLHLAKYMNFSYSPDVLFAKSSQSDVQRAYTNLLFMKAMNFSTTYPLLAYFYRPDDVCNSDFIDACNATAAFYALWRSARSSSKLDNVARDLMLAGLNTDDGSVVVMNWMQKNKRVSIQKYKQALKNVLIREAIWDKDKWMSNARNNLTYQNSAVLSRYILFLTNHDTIADGTRPGLALRGMTDTHEFFSPQRWLNENYNSVEHVAPQQPRSGDDSWSKDIYEHVQGNITHTIGNLTLLPKTMNSIVGNLSWGYKHQFYSYLANPSDERKNELLQLEGKQSIKYSKAAKKTLNSTSLYFHYLKPIVQLSKSDGSRTREIIEARTEFICSLAYDRLTKWLQE